MMLMMKEKKKEKEEDGGGDCGEEDMLREKSNNPNLKGGEQFASIVLLALVIPFKGLMGVISSFVPGIGFLISIELGSNCPDSLLIVSAVVFVVLVVMLMVLFLHR